MTYVDAYKLENGQFYNEIGKIEHDGVEYLLLSNENNSKDICIRKLEKKNDKEYIGQLTKEEFKIIMEKFINKYKNLFSK